MLKNTNVEVVYSIERYTPDAKNKFIDVEIATGRIINEAFISDGRGLITHRIANIPERTVRQTDTLLVDAAGQVTLSRMPIDNNLIEIDTVTQDHTGGQSVACMGYSENDPVVVKYYYNIAGRDWFKEAANFRQVNHPECIGMNDHEYNSYRLWSILVEMGLVSGEMI